MARKRPTTCNTTTVNRCCLTHYASLASSCTPGVTIWNVIDPARSLDEQRNPADKMDMNCREASHAQAAPSTGTTIVACVFKGGVVLGADGRVSIGDYIMNRWGRRPALQSAGLAISMPSETCARVPPANPNLPRGHVALGNNRASNKIAPLADNIFLLRSGSAPDTQIISDNGEGLGVPQWVDCVFCVSGRRGHGIWRLNCEVSS